MKKQKKNYAIMVVVKNIKNFADYYQVHYLHMQLKKISEYQI
jgi:predicted RNA-binding protein associated with RNAse of E/G family